MRPLRDPSGGLRHRNLARPRTKHAAPASATIGDEPTQAGLGL